MLREEHRVGRFDKRGLGRRNSLHRFLKCPHKRNLGGGRRANAHPPNIFSTED